MSSTARIKFWFEERSTDYRNRPMPLPKHAQVDELGVTSAPLKSASFFIGAYCKDYNGSFSLRHCKPRNADSSNVNAEDFMLCKAEDRHPEHCLKEGRRVTRCAQDMQAESC